MNRAIFIISNGRSTDQKTYELIKNITIPVYIVIDNLDEQKNIYLERYENIIIFDKMKYVKIADTMDNKKQINTPLYARIACQDIAKEKKLNSKISNR